MNLCPFFTTGPRPLPARTLETMNTMTTSIILCAALACSVSCSEREPVTVVFTSDVQGRLSPAG